MARKSIRSWSLNTSTSKFEKWGGPTVAWRQPATTEVLPKYFVFLVFTLFTANVPSKVRCPYKKRAS